MKLYNFILFIFITYIIQINSQDRSQDTETYTQESFSDLLKHQKNEGQTLIIARVTTQIQDPKTGKQKTVFHYFDAYNLNKDIFGDNIEYNSYNLNLHNPRNPQAYTNPINKQKIHDIVYFISNSDKETNEILNDTNQNPLFSYKELFGTDRNNWLDYLEKNAIRHNINKYYKMASQYFAQKNYKKAKEYYEKIIQISNFEDKIDALYHLGKINMEGKEGKYGVNKNHQAALIYFNQVANQDYNPDLKNSANLWIGEIYLNNPNLNNNNNKLLDQFKNITDQMAYQTFQEVIEDKNNNYDNKNYYKDYARLWLAKMHLTGRANNILDLKTINSYINDIINNKDNSSKYINLKYSATKARNLLEQIHPTPII